MTSTSSHPATRRHCCRLANTWWACSENPGPTRWRSSLNGTWLATATKSPETTTFGVGEPGEGFEGKGMIGDTQGLCPSDA